MAFVRSIDASDSCKQLIRKGNHIKSRLDWLGNLEATAAEQEGFFENQNFLENIVSTRTKSVDDVVWLK